MEANKNMVPVPSTHFDVSEYEKAFKTFREFADVYGFENIHLVVSEHPYSSGYWIESAYTEVYRTEDHRYYGQEVYELEKRVLNHVQEKIKGKHQSGIIL